MESGSIHGQDNKEKRVKIAAAISASTVLLCVFGCMDEEECVHAPIIDWAKTEPAATELVFHPGSDTSLSFNIANAVVDPDGDEIDTIWYMTHDGGTARFIGTGELAASIAPCDFSYLSLADYFQVSVAVSDGVLKWNSELEPPVDAGGKPLLQRTWLVHLVGSCNGGR